MVECGTRTADGGRCGHPAGVPRCAAGHPNVHRAATSVVAGQVTSVADFDPMGELMTAPPPSRFGHITDPQERHVHESVASLCDRWADAHVQVDAYVTSSGPIMLSLIRVDDAVRGTGAADAAITELCALADQLGRQVVLTAAGDFGASVARLTRWYQRHGFVANTGRNKDYEISAGMYRNPT